MKAKLTFAAMIAACMTSYSQNGTYVAPGGQTGFNTITPANRVEITSYTVDPHYGSINGSSGLRLTNMTNTNTPISSTVGAVLSVDANGDVILVTDQVGSGTFNGAQNGCSTNSLNVVEFGNAYGGSSAQLIIKPKRDSPE